MRLITAQNGHRFQGAALDTLKWELMSDKLHLLGISKAELEDLAAAAGEPRYRATQVFKALHQRRLRSFDEITDLPKRLRTTMAEKADISRLSVESRYVSTDGTRRYLMKTADGYPVETVYIPTENRDTGYRFVRDI